MSYIAYGGTTGVGASGMGWLPVVAAAVAAGGSIFAAKSGAKSAEKDAEAAERAAQAQVRVARVARATQRKADEAATKRWLIVGGIGAVALVGVALILKSGGKKTRKRGRS